MAPAICRSGVESDVHRNHDSMRFHRTPIDGAYLVALDRRGDERGFFARLFCSGELAAQHLESSFVQVNDSMSALAGTLRGLHYQVAPAGEAKLVRCIRGRIFDVLVDIRERSETRNQWFGAELSADNRTMLYVPKGCAHGYLTLDDECELIYFASSPYSPAHERVIRWNDPAFGIEWPRIPVVLSDKDRNAPDFHAESHRSGY